RNNYILNNLQVNGTETTYTQGNWGASVGLQFNSSGLDFLVNAKPVGGSTTVITPVDTMSLREGQVGIGTTSPDMALSVNGNADKASGGTAWSVFSDRRLKNVEGRYERGLSDIVKLEPIRFRYRKDNELHLPHDHEEIGVVAQDARKAFPETVSVSKRGFL